MVNHHKQCCSHFWTAALKHETREQSSSTNGLQLQQPTVAAVTSLPLFLSGRATVHPPRSTGGMQRGATWGIVGIIPDECLQTPRFASTGFIVTVGAGRGLRRHRGRRARASPTTRASRAGVAIMNDGIGTRRVILPLGACRFSRYIPIGNAHLGRRSRYQPLPGSGPRS